MKFTYTFTCRIFHANIMQIKPPITYSYLLMKSQHSISRRPHQNMYTYQITLLYCQILVYKDAFQHQSWCIQVAGDTWKNACLTWQLVMQYSSHLQKSAETSWQLCVIVYPYVCSKICFPNTPTQWAHGSGICRFSAFGKTLSQVILPTQIRISLWMGFNASL